MTGTEFEHIERSTPDLTEENIGKIAALFPDVITEVESPDGEVVHAIDFDALKAKLGDVAEGVRERYQFTWPGKRAAKAEARLPITKTMRPAPERSKDWDTTQNLYIEGDNLDALKILRETYAGKVKLIYIDPPYNTGHDFIYKDDFHKTVVEDREDNGDFDEEGGRLVANPETNGRFHSDWCSMIYPRLLLARDLLTNDGVIFISIDDNEENNLQNICNEIFGVSNYITKLYVQVNPRGRNLDQYVAKTCEPVLCYAKNGNAQRIINKVKKDERMMSEYNRVDENGVYRAIGLRNRNQSFNPVTRPTLFFPLYVSDDGRVSANRSGEFVHEVLPETSVGVKTCWTWSRLKIEEEGGCLFAKKTRNGEWRVYRKDYANKNGESAKTLVKTLWDQKDVNNDFGKKSIKELFGLNIMDFPKSPYLIKRIIEIGTDEESVVLDFFGGSSTTAQSVFMQNMEDGGKRKFILVQLPERASIASSAYAAGYRDICELGEERIRRAGEKIKHEIESENIQGSLDGETKTVPDIGFRVLRIDSSSYEDVRKTPDAYTQGNLEFDVDITKGDRTPLDLLFECLPTFQIPYSASIEQLDGEAFDGYTVYSVNHGQLVACFDEKIPERVMRGMAQLDPKPSYAVVGERSLPDSSARTNFAEIFRQSADALQGQTQIRIL